MAVTRDERRLMKLIEKIRAMTEGTPFENRGQELINDLKEAFKDAEDDERKGIAR